jgi:hypothetical protein
MNQDLTYYFTLPLNDKDFHHIYQLSATQLYGVILKSIKFVALNNLLSYEFLGL